MLEEKLHLLENKISALLGELKTLRQENKSLLDEVTALRVRAREADELTQENGELKRKMNAMENDITANNGKEQEIRERLRNIIEKIDAIEQMSVHE